MLPTGKYQNNYYLEAVKLYYQNCILYHQFDKVLIERNQILERLGQIAPEEPTNRKCVVKKLRRRANQIQKSFQCKYGGCAKIYGTEGSLVQHMRLKHDQLIRTNALRQE